MLSIRQIPAPHRIGKAWESLATHCVQGHEYTPENTYRRPEGARRCRTCDRLRALPRMRAVRARGVN